MKKTNKMLAVMVVLAMLVSYFVPLTAFAVDKELSITISFQNSSDAEEGCVQYNKTNDENNWQNLVSGQNTITYDSEQTVRIRIVANPNYGIDWTATSCQSTIGETVEDSIQIKDNTELQEFLTNGYTIDSSVTAFSLSGVEFSDNSGGDPANPPVSTQTVDVHFPNATINGNVVTFTVDEVDYTATISGTGAAFGTQDPADAEILYITDVTNCTFTISDNFNSETMEVRITSRVDGWNGVLAVNSYTASLNGINFPNGGLDFAVQKINTNNPGDPNDPPVQTQPVDVHFPNATSIEENVVTFTVDNVAYTATVSGTGAHFGVAANNEETNVLYVTDVNNCTFTISNNFSSETMEVRISSRVDGFNNVLAVNSNTATLSGIGFPAGGLDFAIQKINSGNPGGPTNVSAPNLKAGYLVVAMDVEEGAAGSVNYFFKDSQGRWLTKTGAVIGGENLENNQKEPAGEIKSTDATKEVAIPANVDKIYLGIITDEFSDVYGTTFYNNDNIQSINKDLLVHTRTYEYDYTANDKVGLSLGLQFWQDENLYVPDENGTYLNINFMGDDVTAIKYWNAENQEISVQESTLPQDPISVGRVVKLQIPKEKLGSVQVNIFNENGKLVNADMSDLTAYGTQNKNHFDDWKADLVNGNVATLDISGLEATYSFVFNITLKDPMEPYNSHTLTWNNMKGSGWGDDTLIEGGKARIVQAYKNNVKIWDINETYPDSNYDVDNQGNKTDKFIYGEVANRLDNGYPLYEFDICQTEDGGEVHAVAGIELVVEFTPNYGKQLVAVSMGEEAGNAQGTAKYYKVTMPANHVHFNAQFANVNNESLVGNNTSVSGMEYSLENGALDSGTAVLSIDKVDNLSDQQKANFADQAGDNYLVSTYLDVDLTQVWFKGKNAQFNESTGYSNSDVWSKEIYDLGDKKATITITLDEGISPDDVIILHELHDTNGNVTGYETVTIVSKNKDTNGIWTVTFETSKFSNYAIAEKKDETPTSFEVTFETNGGTAVQKQTVASGETAERPAEDPKKENCKFVDWYEDSTCQVKFDFTKPITKETKIYAKWDEIPADTRVAITGINITIDAPKVGDVISITNVNQGNSGYTTSNIPPVVTAEEGANYTVEYPCWVKGTYTSYGEGYDDLFEGTIAKDTYYYALVNIYAKENYKITLDTLSNIKVNGAAPAEVFNVYDDGNNTYFIAKVKSQLVYEVLPDDNSSETLQATAVVSKMINALINGEDVEGISAELKDKIIEAVNDGKTLTVDVEISKVPEEELEEDVKIAKQGLGNSFLIGAVFDISVIIKADGDYLGNVTNTNSVIEIDVQIPENLPDVKAGYTREFTIARVHNGRYDKLRTWKKARRAYAESNLFSTYVLAYTDVPVTNNTSNPKTGDSIFVYVAMLATGVVGIALTRKAKNNAKARKH